MKKIVILLCFLVLYSIVIWFLADRFYQNKISLLQQEKTTCQKGLAQKDKVLASVKKSSLYFSARTEKLAANQWKVIIDLQGDPAGLADAADLKLDLPSSASISAFNNGLAFPIYPRKVISNQYLLITGLATFENNQVVFGQPNKIFADFIVSFNNPTSNDKKIILNQNDTKIYLNGESVYDGQKSITQIGLQ